MAPFPSSLLCHPCRECDNKGGEWKHSGFADVEGTKHNYRRPEGGGGWPKPQFSNFLNIIHAAPLCDKCISQISSSQASLYITPFLVAKQVCTSHPSTNNTDFLNTRSPERGALGAESVLCKHPEKKSNSQKCLKHA